MTTRQLASIMLSCMWFAHPLSIEQCIGSSIDGLNQKLMCTVLEIEKLKEEASEETRKHKEHVKQLLHLLSITMQERDEARNQLQKLLNNSILTSSTESLNILPQFYVENPILIPTNANSGITESNSLSTLSETYNYTSRVSSPVDSFFDAVSSPDVSNFNVLSANQFGPSVQMIDRASLIIDNLAKDRVLPQNGKFLQAVIEAGQSGLMAGPLPMWRNPPRVQAFQIPPVPMKGYDHEAFAQTPVSNTGQFMLNYTK